VKGPARVRLTFPEALVTEPIVGRMVQQFDVLPNIRRASIDADVGWMICELDGPPDVVEAAISWLVALGVGVDRLGDLLEG
jgi:ABC-type methionine transport system ATPase subunit